MKTTFKTIEIIAVTLSCIHSSDDTKEAKRIIEESGFKFISTGQSGEDEWEYVGHRVTQGKSEVEEVHRENRNLRARIGTLEANAKALP